MSKNISEKILKIQKSCDWRKKNKKVLGNVLKMFFFLNQFAFSMRIRSDSWPWLNNLHFTWETSELYVLACGSGDWICIVRHEIHVFNVVSRQTADFFFFFLYIWQTSFTSKLFIYHQDNSGRNSYETTSSSDNEIICSCSLLKFSETY